MNAVKRCLALIAATVAVGACSGDPTADLAGADLTIRATPGAVWMQEDKTTTVLVEAVDATGAPAPGDWTTSHTGVIDSVVTDVDFQPTNGGPLGNGRQYVIWPTSVGNGSVTFTGTAGTRTVAVRVAPAPFAFDAPVSNTHPGRVNDPITVTAPAGLRFTSVTAANIVQVGGIKHNGFFAPIITGMSADSTVVTLSLSPNSDGQVQLSGIASTETPTLTSTAATITTVFVDSLFVPGMLSASHPTLGQPMTLTAPAGFKFRPGSAVSSTGDSWNAGQWAVVSVSADSSTMVAIPPSAVHGRVTVDSMTWDSLPTMILAIPSFDSMATDTVVSLGADDFFGGGGAAALGQITAPTVTGDAVAFIDKGTWSAPDNFGDGCSKPLCEVDVQLTFPAAGTYQVDLTWNTGADVDLSVVDDTYTNALDGSYNGAGVDEQVTYTATAGEKIILVLSMFDGTAPSSYRVLVTKVP